MNHVAWRVFMIYLLLSLGMQQIAATQVPEVRRIVAASASDAFQHTQWVGHDATDHLPAVATSWLDRSLGTQGDALVHQGVVGLFAIPEGRLITRITVPDAVVIGRPWEIRRQWSVLGSATEGCLLVQVPDSRGYVVCLDNGKRIEGAVPAGRLVDSCNRSTGEGTIVGEALIVSKEAASICYIDAGRIESNRLPPLKNVGRIIALCAIRDSFGSTPQENWGVIGIVVHSTSAVPEILRWRDARLPEQCEAVGLHPDLARSLISLCATAGDDDLPQLIGSAFLNANDKTTVVFATPSHNDDIGRHAHFVIEKQQSARLVSDEVPWDVIDPETNTVAQARWGHDLIFVHDLDGDLLADIAITAPLKDFGGVVSVMSASTGQRLLSWAPGLDKAGTSVDIDASGRALLVGMSRMIGAVGPNYSEGRCVVLGLTPQTAGASLGCRVLAEVLSR